MQKYEHGGDVYANPGVKLDFSVNTNPFGMPEEIRRALTLRMDEFAWYPDTKCRELCAGLSAYENLPQDYILCGNGAADLIYRMCYAIKPKKALVTAPTFSEYELALDQVCCHVERHFLKAENLFELGADIESSLAPDVDILFLCNPNNPTGSLISSSLMERIVARASKNNTIIVVDECFLDFTDGVSAKRFLGDSPGLIVLKAFTKMYSMAGLRLGYLLCSDRALVEKISTAAQCWSVSVPAQIAGVAALSCSGWIEKTRRLIGKQRPDLSEKLAGLGITVFPSEANFLLLRSEKPLYELLLQKGILIRRCQNFCGLDASYFRVAVKTEQENAALINALKEIAGG